MKPQDENPQGPSRLEFAGNLFGQEGLQLVTHLEILEVHQTDSTFESAFYRADIFLESLQAVYFTSPLRGLL